MTRFLLVLLFFSISCDPDVDPLHKQCGQPCIEIDGQILVSGQDACSGTLMCEGEETRCEGYRPSTSETCNGLDDDCDGDVDEDTGYAPLEEGNPCLSLIGECHKASAVCLSGSLACQDLEHSEECNGLDDDCDGDVDEGLGTLGYEYHGPDGTANVGACRAGALECVDGVPTLRGEVVPSEELCGDEVDSDCDGALNPEGGGGSHDVVLVIDYSGSMYGYLQDVTDAVCTWAQGDSAEHNFAAIGVSFTSLTPDYNQVLFDFETPDEACADLYTAMTEGQGIGDEYVPDAIILGHEAPLSFSGVPKDFVVFSDEPIQPNVHGAFDVTQDCQYHNYTITTFTSPMLLQSWDSMISHPCGGTTEELSSAGVMSARLLTLFGTMCGGG